MIRILAQPIPMALLLFLATFVPVAVAAVRTVQIPLGWLPDDSLRLTAAPVSHWLHAVSGSLFGLLGLVQFALVPGNRSGAPHRLAGRVFVVAGLVLAASGLGLLLGVDSVSTPALDMARALFSFALVVALVMGVHAARTRNPQAHRAWMIRAYALGMGGATVALILLPIHLIHATPLAGPMSDLVLVGWWLVTIALGEWIIRLLRQGKVPA